MTTVSLRRRRPGYYRAAAGALVVAASIMLGFAAIRRRAISRHRLAVAEWAVRRRPAPRRRPQPAVVGAQP